MTKTIDHGKDAIAKLCQYFATNRQSFIAPGVKEAHIRQSLIDPFFEALGWDVRNSAMVAPQYREVVPEDSLEVEGAQKAPDYTFRVGSVPKFYAEAKKCGVNIHADIAPAYQLRRYGWSGKVAVSILTDFEELAVYDCTRRPRPTDKAGNSRILYFGFAEYPDRWRELWDVFSREAVWSGAFDQYAASKRKRGTSEVDVEFLAEIEGWRDSLARNMALRNKGLSPEDLNAAVQRTIDRIVFLRMAEDRGLEPYEQLLKLTERPNIYPRFVKDLCRKADDKYNSGLFHFRVEKDEAESPDRLTPGLAVDDGVMKPILQSLYFAHGSPYHFGVLPVEILGTVYERFLGKVIRLTAGHQAKIEEKPEVRKAGGVYYTPAFIVDYIVKQTIGKQVTGLSPAQLAGGKNKAPFRVLDMACGSGSFLLGAYQCLLEHCLKWYVDHNPANKRKNVFQDSRSGAWKLTIEEKKRILLAHIFGVDIDAQAVEVTKLSLLLKALEGENDATLSMQFGLFHERALPNLSENIRCGNSLIGPDYFSGTLIPDDEEIRRVNAFDWSEGFPAAMSDGGFDCIIGNPPYVLLQDANRDDAQMEYFKREYEVASFKVDTYHLFMERSTGLVREGGHISMITPANFMTNNHLAKLRMHLIDKLNIEHIVVINGGVFEKVSVDNAIFVAKREAKKAATFDVIRAESTGASLRLSGKTTIKISDVRASEFTLFTGGADVALGKVWRHIEKEGVQLGEIAKVNFGKQLRDRKIHKRDVIEVTSVKSVPRTHRPCYGGKDIQRYSLQWGKLACLDDEVAQSGGCWDSGAQNAKNKLLTRQIGRHPDFAIDKAGFQCLNALFMVNVKDGGPDPRYLLGLLNSKLLRRYWVDKYFDGRKTFPKIKGTYLKKLPIRLVETDGRNGRAEVKKLCALVDRMTSLQGSLRSTKSETQKRLVQRQIDGTDRDIDQLVYKIYGLSDAEVSVIEAE